MSDAERLEQELRRIDGRGYKAYKDIRGSYRLDDCVLHIDHVQGDPFASPSRMCIEVDRLAVGLGDDLDPIISYPAWEQFSGGKLENVFPDDTHNFASNPVALTLEQMRRIDLGERLCDRIGVSHDDHGVGFAETQARLGVVGRDDASFR